MNSELNRIISDILRQNQVDVKTAIQQLFNLLNTQPEGSHTVIYKAILFSMENLHEWANIMKYTSKWKMDDYKKGLIVRMRKRLSLSEEKDNDISENDDDLGKLVEMYWARKSPKREENVYRQPILIKKLIRNSQKLNENNIIAIKNEVKLAKCQVANKAETISKQQKQQKEILFSRNPETQPINSIKNSLKNSVDEIIKEPKSENVSENIQNKADILQKQQPSKSFSMKNLSKIILKNKAQFRSTSNSLVLQNMVEQVKIQQKVQQIKSVNQNKSNFQRRCCKFTNRHLIQRDQKSSKPNNQTNHDSFKFQSNKKMKDYPKSKKITPVKFDPTDLNDKYRFTFSRSNIKQGNALLENHMDPVSRQIFKPTLKVQKFEKESQKSQNFDSFRKNLKFQGESSSQGDIRVIIKQQLKKMKQEKQSKESISFRQSSSKNRKSESQPLYFEQRQPIEPLFLFPHLKQVNDKITMDSMNYLKECFEVMPS